MGQYWRLWGFQVFYVKVVLGSWDDSRPCFSVFIAWLGLTVDTPASVYGLFGLQFSRFLREGAELPQKSRKVWLHCETIFGKCFLSASQARRWMPLCVSLAPNFAHFLREGGRGNQDFLRTPCLWLFCSVSSPEEQRKIGSFSLSHFASGHYFHVPSYQVATCVVSRSPEEYQKFLFLLGDGFRNMVRILYVWFDIGYSSCVRHGGF